MSEPTEPASEQPPPEVPHDPYSAFRIPSYRAFFLGNVTSVFGVQMQSTAVGWELYQRTNSKLVLGFVGLVQFLPVLCLALVTGHVADRFNRQTIVRITASLIACSSLGLAAISHWKLDYRWMYLCLLITGACKAFQQPAKTSLVPNIVPAEEFSNAVTWNTTGFHLACILGPAAGGAFLAWHDQPSLVYLLDFACAMVFVGAISVVKQHPQALLSTGASNRATLQDLLAGFKFLWQRQTILAAIALDMFAVLLGGATALLPVFADDILKCGASGLGIMRLAPAAGACLMGLAIAHIPKFEHSGRVLLWSVVGFGFATIGFGLATSMWVATLMLFLTGVFDNVSVVIRHTLVQRLTPNELRGRVSSVNSLFIGASNELGGFESGLVAEFFGPVTAVVSGGIGTLGVVAFTAVFAPQLRDYKKD